MSMGCGASKGNPNPNVELNNIARNTNNCDRARALVSAGAELSSTNGPHWRHTPLHQACYHGRYEMAKCLVDLGAPLTLHSNPCGRGRHGTPLELARGGGHERIATMIAEAIAKDAQGKRRSSKGTVATPSGTPSGTPSHGNPASSNSLNTELNNIARNTNNCDRARALVSAGAELSSTNGPHWRHTPLHQACYHGRYEMAKCLVDLGAPLTLHSNPCGRGRHGTPLELARGGGHERIAKMLEDALAAPPPVVKALNATLGLPLPPTSKLKPYTGPSRRLVLVNKGDRDQCVFSHASNLSRGEDVDLTLSSHPGLVIGRQYGEEKRHGPWRYIEAGVKGNVQPVRARYIEGNYVKLTDADLVFDVSFWKMETGNTVNFVGGTNRKDKTKLKGGGRDWVINR